MPPIWPAYPWATPILKPAKPAILRVADRPTLLSRGSYRSVRDPDGRANLALLSPGAFRATRPDGFETWHLFLRDAAVQAVREMPWLTLEIPFSAWTVDPRVPNRLPR